MKSLDGRVAAVTGGASGIGLAVASVLSAEGASVAIGDLDGSRAQAAADQLCDAGRDVFGVALDVADPASGSLLAEACLSRWGRVDILAANAGVYPAAELAEIDDAFFDKVIGINVKGAIHAMQACIPVMRTQRYGRVILTSSITGPMVGAVGYGTYGASKAALLGLMRSVALEVAGDLITVNAVMPGNVATPGFAESPLEWQQRLLRAIPLGRLADPEEVGWAVRFFAAEESAYITGQTLVLDGGQVLPEA